MNAADLISRIAYDIAEEARQASIAAVFRGRAEAKRPPPTPRATLAVCPWPRVTHLASPDPEGEADDGFDYAHAAEGDYQAVCQNQTGRIVPEEAFADLRQRREEMDAQTVEIAKALECRGEKFYYGPNHPSSCTLIGLYSGAILPMPAVRRVAFLPAVAAGNRAKMLRDVEHFLGCHTGNARMFTITNGKRVPIHRITLREDTKDFHRWLSKMAADSAFKIFGLQMEWRATEFGSPKWDPETGQMTLHLHAHCLVTEPVGMSKKRRGKLRRKLWKTFGVHWDDAGTIENAREFVKYPVKPGDVDTILREAGPGVLCDFYDAIKGLHIVQPMGELRAIRSRRRAAARRVTAFSRMDGRTLEETGDWNAEKRPFAKPSGNRERIQWRELWLRLVTITKLRNRIFPGIQSHDEGVTELVAKLDDGNRRELGDTSRKSPRIANRIIARLAPAPYGSAVCEPAVVVWGFDGNLRAVLEQPRAARIIAQHRGAWDNAQQARALIRACAQAPAPRAARQGSQRSNNCPGGLAELALLDSESDPPDHAEAAFAARN